MRIAVYGFVTKDGGSSTSAHYLLLEHLLKLGHSIDFFAIDGFINPEGLDAFPNYNYIPCRVPGVLPWWRFVERRVPRFLRRQAILLLSLVSNALHYRVIRQRLFAEHVRDPYDALLSLDLLCPFRVPFLPVVSWPQGTALGEWQALRNNRRLIGRLCGGWFYGLLGAFYWYRRVSSRSLLRNTDLILCGGRWSAESWRLSGFPANLIHPLAYPVDLARFSPEERFQSIAHFRFLHLGRLVPRKRLDLLLAAFQLVRAEFPKVELLVVGEFAYAKGYANLLHDPRLMAGVEYRARVPREQARQLLLQADALVQPSENENFGMAVAEAQACGVPPITGPTNATGDYVGAAELRFSAYTPEALASCMRNVVLLSPHEVLALRRRLREAAVTAYSVSSIGDRLLEFLGSLSRARRAPSS